VPCRAAGVSHCSLPLLTATASAAACRAALRAERVGSHPFVSLSLRAERVPCPCLWACPPRCSFSLCSAASPSGLGLSTPSGTRLRLLAESLTTRLVPCAFRGGRRLTWSPSWSSLLTEHCSSGHDWLMGASASHLDRVSSRCAGPAGGIWRESQQVLGSRCVSGESRGAALRCAACGGAGPRRRLRAARCAVSAWTAKPGSRCLWDDGVNGEAGHSRWPATFGVRGSLTSDGVWMEALRARLDRSSELAFGLLRYVTTGSAERSGAL
jgi:hypothetical protein